VARFLAASGVEEVYNLRGGMQAWSHDIEPDMPVA
jgi:rhodanese-related sulfurtransferase